MPSNQHDRAAPAMPGAGRSVLSVAAVIGDEFEIPILAAATGLSHEQIQPHLNELERDGFIQRMDGDKCRFPNTMARQAIYDGLEAYLRSRLHRQIGEAVEKLYGVDSDEHIEELAHHFGQGTTPETTEKAIDYLKRAGDEAYRLKSYEQAGQHWRLALKLMPADEGMRERHLEVLHRLEREPVSTGFELISYLQRSIRILESIGDNSRLGHAHALLAHHLSLPLLGAPDLVRAKEHLEKAETLLSGPADRKSLQRVYYAKAEMSLHSVDARAGLQDALRSLKLADEIDSDHWRSHSEMMAARHLFALGRIAEAFAYLKGAEEDASGLEDPFCGQVIAHAGGIICSDLFDPSATIDRCLKELALSRTSKSVHQSRILQTQVAHNYVQIGQLDQGRRMLAILRGPGASTALPWEDGDWERTTASYLKRINRDNSIGDLEEVALRSWHFGSVLRVRGMLEESEKNLLEAWKLHRAAPNLPRMIGTAQELCLLYFDMERREDARPILAECLEILAGGEDWRGLEGAVIECQALVYAMDRHFLQANAEFGKAVDIFKRYRKRWMEAELFLYWGRALIAASDLPRANEKLDQAVAVYREMGAGQRFIDWVNQSRARSTIPVAAPNLASSSNECSFVRAGAIWTISHRNRTFRIRDMKGLRYIAHLLEHPGEEFHVLDLVTAIDGVANAAASSPNEDLRITNDLGDAGEILDKRSKAEYRNRREELRADLNDAEAANDRGRTQRIRAELEMLDEQLSSAMGLGGRDRKTGDHSERARDRIRKSIHKSLESIRENDPSLGHHLTTCIRTGYLCSYQPDPGSN